MNPTERDVLAALNDDWRKSREIWQAMGRWSPIYVKAELNRLALVGTIERRIEPKTLSAYQYRRPPRRLVHRHPCG